MGKLTTIASSIFVIVAICFPIFISEVLGGWTKKYTSPVRFTAAQIPDLTNKVVIVTGANTGIGFQTALELARANAHVIVTARSDAKGVSTVNKITQEVKDANVQYLPLDLASLKSVSMFAELFKKLNLPLNILILNAGVMKSPGALFVGKALNYGFETTKDGFEYHIGVNHIAHAHLTNLLLPKLKSSAPSRIISVSSNSERGAPESGMKFSDWWVPKNGVMPSDYEDGIAYGQSKLANLMYSRELSKILNGTDVSVYSLHPGIITTELLRYMEPVMKEDIAKSGAIKAFFMNVIGKLFDASLFDSKGGALTQLHLAVEDQSKLVSGGFYHPIGRYTDPYHPQGLNETLANVLWRETNTAIKMGSKYRFSK